MPLWVQVAGGVFAGGLALFVAYALFYLATKED